MKVNRTITVGVITASDRGAAGDREDLSGKVIANMVQQIGGEVIEYQVVPDEQQLIEQTLLTMADGIGVDLIITTGGTGLGPRDVTPDATLAVIERRVPGMAEAMRAESLKKTNRAMLSRAEAGTRGKTVIINLPGSPKAVEECLAVVLPTLPHAVEVLQGGQLDCAKDRETE